MSEEVITKRLHVSGLTPAIRPEDLSQKLASFGTIKALDVFGTVDGLGQPRKFGYVTIETSKAKLARCMNLLSGVTWKGAKLRIGEAKPDFRERLAQEREKMKEETEGPPKKKRRLPRGVQGIHSPDMSLVTQENVRNRAGWRVTSSGRLIRPIRMRPDHPLPKPIHSSSSSSQKGKQKIRTKKRTKLPPTRARRRTIDPTKWGSVHLKGVFLQNMTIASDTHHPKVLAEVSVQDDVVEGSEDDQSEAGDNEREQKLVSGKLVPAPATGGRAAVPDGLTTVQTQPIAILSPLQTQRLDQETNLMEEKNASLGLLRSLFGDQEDWGGEESLESDMEVDVLQRGASGTSIEDPAAAAAAADFEVVPMDYSRSRSADVDAASDASAGAEAKILHSVPPPSQKPADKPTNLKDLFAPKGDAGGFSLLGHLDLDSDLDDDDAILGTAFAPVPAEAASVPESEIPLQATRLQSSQTRSQIIFDPSLPLFFPLSEEERAGFRGRVKDLFDVFRENGWDWRDFRRTESSEEIRKQWEEQKRDLTKDWKRRHREAVKARKRRGGADGE